MGGVGDFRLFGWPQRPPPAVVLTVGGWLAGLAVTVLILATPYLRFGYRNPSLHLVLETVDGSVALLLCYLVFGRFGRTGRVQDVLLAHGFLLLAVASLGVALSEGVLGEVRGNADVWLPLLLRVLGSLLVAAAALCGPHRATARRRPLPLGLGLRWGPPVLAALGSAALWLQRDGLPAALSGRPPVSAEHPVIAGNPLLLVVQGVSALCFVVASVAFTVQVLRRDDELLRWLGAGCAVAAFARVNYELFPSLYSDWFYTGDVLRTGSYLLLIVGAAREIQQYWSAQARVAVLEDRRRLARELHDGVVQELGYIRAEAHGIDAERELRDRVIASCDRALDEARAAIYTLGSSAEEPLSLLVRQAAQEVATRYGGYLDDDLDDSVSATADQRHALARITREAVSNALRHGQATKVSVRLLRERGARQLVVADDGTGFDVDAAARRAGGYGLTSMRERARSLPGTLSVESAPGRGTVIGVTW